MLEVHIGRNICRVLAAEFQALIKSGQGSRGETGNMAKEHTTSMNLVLAVVE